MSEATPARVPEREPCMKPRALIRGTYLTTDLGRVRRFFEEVLGMDCVRHERDAMLVREAGHRPGGAKVGQPYWVLEVRQVESIPVPQDALNHWGVDVSSEAEVDAACEALKVHAAEYGITRVQKPRHQHNAYAFYFSDVDRNWWEIEYRAPDFVYTAIRARGDQV